MFVLDLLGNMKYMLVKRTHDQMQKQIRMKGQPHKKEHPGL